LEDFEMESWRRIVGGRRALYRILIGGALALAVYYLLVGGRILTLVGPLRQARINLLCRTDHQALLEACRDLSIRVTSGELQPKRYYVYRPSSPEVSTFPQAILDLEPSTVSIEGSGIVSVAVVGGLDHCGVIFYPEGIEDQTAPPGVESQPYGDRKLLDGLWYYDDGYQRDPHYDRKVDVWIKKYGTINSVKSGVNPQNQRRINMRSATR